MNTTLREIGDNLLGAALIGAHLVFRPLLQGWFNRWGATEAEVNRILPGDDLVPHPKRAFTRAITIHAPADEVWPWLIQIGQGRGGLYSYELLENLARCDMHNADRIVPEWQHPALGDKIRLGPEGFPFFYVQSVQPGQALVLVTGDVVQVTPGSVTLQQDLPKQYVLNHWAFILEPVEAHTTRLITRGYLDYMPQSRANWIMWVLLTEPIGFVMMRRMLLGIRQRAEAARRTSPQLQPAR